MKTINKRVYIIFALAVIFLSFTVVLAFSVFSHADEYAMKTANGHLFSSGVLVSGGDITDRNGVVLAYSEDNERKYNDDEDIRTAMLHILGDNEGFIAGGIQSTFRKELAGYSLVLGVNRDDKNNMKLTLDAELCAAAYDALGSYKGTVGIYNYKTGEIVCAVSKPSYDLLDKPEFDDDSEEYDGVYINRLFSGLYVPGSVFKTVTALCAVENIGDIFTRTFYCDGKCNVGDGEVICNDVHGEVTFEEALNQSCNCAFAEIAAELGSEKLTQTFIQAGFVSDYSADRMTVPDSRLELTPDMPKVDLGWAGIGQYTTLVNPYAMMTYMGAIANGGRTVLPYFVESVISDKGNTVYTAEKADSGIAIPQSSAAVMKTLLRSDVENYYGDYRFGDLELCGKSGTAEVGEDKQPHAWFTGFSADEDFPYAFVAVVENGGSGLYNAGGVISEVLQELED